MTLKKLLYTITITLLFTACVAPTMMTINQETVDAKYTKTYNSDMEKTLTAIKAAITELDWVLLEEHRNVLKRLKNGKQSWHVETKKAFYAKSDYKYSWSVVAPKTVVDDLIFLKLRTPMSVTSYGAKLYVGVSLKKGKVSIRYSASTNQSYEREKLLDYLSNLSLKVEEKLQLLQP